MRKYMISASIAAAVMLAFAAGMRFGAEPGAAESAKVDSAFKAALLAGELRVLRAGSSEKLIETKEIELDGNVVQAIHLQQSGMSWIFWPREIGQEQTRSLERVAQYHAQHPAIVPKTVPPEATRDSAGLRAHAEKVEQSTAVLIERFGRQGL